MTVHLKTPYAEDLLMKLVEFQPSAESGLPSRLGDFECITVYICQLEAVIRF